MRKQQKTVIAQAAAATPGTPARTLMLWASALGIAIALTAFSANAQYAGPVEGPAQADVKSILDKPVDDQKVRVQGVLLRKTGDEMYVFSDGTGEIMVEIDDDDFPPQSITEKTKVELVGEVDTGLRRAPEIEVDQVRVLP